MMFFRIPFWCLQQSSTDKVWTSVISLSPITVQPAEPGTGSRHVDLETSKSRNLETSQPALEALDGWTTDVSLPPFPSRIPSLHSGTIMCPRIPKWL
jgi:hypothetical protein